ncbi:hypothetical protein QPK24_16180 [Paenibacillus polygoni]|uniref:Zinc finger protein n=1 Tax=Paenibacillus polygoni TaxID=3050112 RepID=A0ABY8WXU6_9BACL|nr:hypothetical protein [Paenibacillus polygoni]WIV17942.1 hypothetical protein QPK24_16180 [Paenibacillus polygoni]
MNCNEAQECMAQVWDLSAHHPVRVELNKHIEECPDCAFEYSRWEELYDLIPETSDPVPEKSLQSMHSKVMDKIYSDHPHIQRTDIKPYKWMETTVNRFSIWISACLAVLLCSIVLMVWKISMNDATGINNDAGIVPTGIASSAPAFSLPYHDPKGASGIIEPFVAGIPAYPEYWMFISLLALGMALFSLRRMHHITK